MASFPPAESITSCPKLVNIEMNKTGNLDPFALYTLVTLNQREDFRNAVVLDDAMPAELNDAAQFPPIYDFTGKSLQDIVKYHFSLFKDSPADDERNEQRKFDYNYFIVAIHEDYEKHGVLIVDLVNDYYDDFESVPGIARAPLESDLLEYKGHVSAFGWCINLQIANMGFDELQDQEESIQWPCPIPGYHELQTILQASRDGLKRKAQARFAQLPDRDKRYAVWAFPEAHGLRSRIEPDEYMKEKSDCEGKVATNPAFHHGRDPHPGTERLNRIRREFPRMCTIEDPGSEPFWGYNKFWMFLLDDESVRNEDVALMHVEWDGVTDGKSKEELEAIMPQVKVMERCPLASALERMDELAGSIHSRT